MAIVIASFSNNFIFIKTRKTGGTSVEIVLSTWCSGSDICSPISDSDEPVRIAMGGHQPTKDRSEFYNHMPAVEIKRAVPDLWAKAFKFTVERHPYEKAISRAYWNIGKRGGNPDKELCAELERVITRSTYLNYPLYTIDDILAVDEVILYDNLWVRMAELAAKFKHGLPETLPQTKAQYRKDRRPARDILSDRQKKAIREAARFEFEAFGFET